MSSRQEHLHVGSLQLRIIDGIRTRVVQVEERDAGRPVRVGSGADCDIRVGTGAAVQCELFVHKGRWVIKKASDDASIHIGGKVVSSGAYLNPDDRIVLGDGNDTAVIEVGPVAVAAAGAMARPTGPEAIPELMSPGQEDEGWLREDADEVVPVDVGPVSSRSSRRRPPGKRPAGSMGWTVALTLVIVGAGGAALWKFRPREQAPAPVPVVRKETPKVSTTAPVATPTRDQASIFDAGWRPPVKQSAGPADPRKLDEDWVALEKAVNGPSPARAIYVIHEYREKHPRQFEAELNGFLEDASDRIWWQRIKELCDRRDELRAEIQRLSDSIAEETEEEFRKKLEEQRSQKEGMLRWELETLTKEMGYVGKEAPNVADEEMIRQLRGERDSGLYEAWKGKVIKSVVATRGYLPWERTK